MAFSVTPLQEVVFRRGNAQHPQELTLLSRVNRLRQMGKFNMRSTVSSRREERSGHVMVEFAVVLPLFLLFLFALFEFGHFFMVRNALTIAAQRAARVGASDGSSTADTQTKAEEAVDAIVGTVNATILVKDASIFDTPGVDPETIDYANLPDIALANAEPTDMFLVRIEVDYDDVAVLPPKFVPGVVLVGQSAMRRE